MLGGTIALPSQAGGCEQVTSEAVWGHDCVTIAGFWQRATYQRRCLGTRLRYLRRLVAVNYLPAKMFGDTIAIPSQACGCEQLLGERCLGTRLHYNHKFVTVSNSPAKTFGTRLCYHRRLVAVNYLLAKMLGGTNCVTIARLWLCETSRQKMFGDTVTRLRYNHKFVTAGSLRAT